MDKYWKKFFTASPQLADYIMDNKESLSFKVTELQKNTIKSILMARIVLYILGSFLLLSAGQAILEYFSLSQSLLWCVGICFIKFSKNSSFEKIQYAIVTAVIVLGQSLALFAVSGEFGTASYQYVGFKFNNFLMVVYLTFFVYTRHYLAILALDVMNIYEKRKKTVTFMN